MSLVDSARKLPLHHLSVRVPWHDAGWDGTVCRRPVENAACLVLKNIRDGRDDGAEEKRAGRTWSELEPGELPPCIGERAGFMAPFSLTRMAEHPYVALGSDAHRNFAPTAF